MPFRQIYMPALGRSVGNIMGCLSSAETGSHEPALETFRRLGGNCLHVHGEGGEIHSRVALGQWLHRNGLRSDTVLCSQVCHEGWNPATKQALDRFTPEALREDIAADLDRLKTDYLDIVYAANASDVGMAPFIDAMAEEVARGRVRAYGARNWTSQQLRDAQDYARRTGKPGLAVVVTTELALPAAAQPLWPEDIPFAQLDSAVCDLGLAVFAHADDFNQGLGLFDDEPTANERWSRRWDRQANAALMDRLRQLATAKEVSPRTLALTWLLNRPFPSVALVSLNELLSFQAIQFETASEAIAEDLGLSAFAAVGSL